jgi:hypothetical protein
LAQRDQEILEELERIQAAGKSGGGRDAETATRVIEMLTPERAGRGGGSQATVTKRRRSAIRMSTADEPRRRPGEKRRKRQAAESQDG